MFIWRQTSQPASQSVSQSPLPFRRENRRKEQEKERVDKGGMVVEAVDGKLEVVVQAVIAQMYLDKLLVEVQVLKVL